MGYIGAKPLTSEYYFDVFDGDGVTFSWPTTIAPATPVSVFVTVDGVVVDPQDYYFEGSNIYFFTAPAAGSRNIQLRYLAVPSSGVAAPHTYRQVDEFTATEGQTTFNVRFYDLGYVDVFVNGVQLGNNDFQASDNETIILQVGARNGDLVRIVSAYNTVLTRSYYNQVANTVLIGNGEEAFQEVAPGVSGNILTSNGTNWIASNVITGDVTITGELTVSGNTTTVSVNNVSLANGLMYLADSNPTNLIDIGTVGSFTSGTYQHTGFVRDATDGVWKLFSNVASEPTSTIDFTFAEYDTIQVGSIISGGVDLNIFGQASFDYANATNILTQSSFDHGNSAYGHSNTTLTYAQSGFAHANSAHEASNVNSTSITTIQAVDTTQNTSISYAFSQANSAYSKANSSNVLAQAAFDQANTTLGLPQNAQSATYALANTDQGKHVYFTNSTNVNLYVPNNGQVNFPVGTTIVIVSKTSSSANVVVTPNTGVSMYLAGNTTSTSRTVTTYGMATLLNTGANTWFINGTGVV